MNRNSETTIWNNLITTLDTRSPDWHSRVMGYGQVDLANKRAAGENFTDEEVFRGVLWAVLSSNTDWSKVHRVLPELESQLGSYSPETYAAYTNESIDGLYAWFISKKAGSPPLGPNLKRLRETAKILVNWSAKNGSADSYFVKAINFEDDPIVAALLLGILPGYKLPCMGVAIAAETLRNLGYELAKPDRHICRALGSWGLVKYANWKNRNDNKGPTANNDELLETMRAMDRFGKAVNESPTYLDNVIWFACSKGGPNLTNDELRQFAVQL